MLILHIAHQLINSIDLPRAHEVEYMLNLRRAQSQDGQIKYCVCRNKLFQTRGAE